MDLLQPNQIISTRVIVEYGTDIALIRRAPTGEYQGSWELPGGKMDPGENILEAALRETQQETGLEVELLNNLPKFIEERNILDGKHRGRHYQAFGFVGIAASMDIELSDEHTDFLWLPPAEALALPLTTTSARTITKLGALLNSRI